MTEEEIAALISQHLRVPDEYHFWICKCGEKRYRRRKHVKGWPDHLAAVIAGALGGSA